MLAIALEAPKVTVEFVLSSTSRFVVMSVLVSHIHTRKQKRCAQRQKLTELKKRITVDLPTGVQGPNNNKRMRLFCLQLEASCLQWSLLLIVYNFSFFTHNWSFLLTALALLLAVGAFLLTMGKYV